MAMAPSMLDFSVPMGCLKEVIFAGQGEMKKTPIS
jgi:hypothetical protein